VYGSGAVEVRALDGVSIDFERARFTAMMGPSGYGKSTLMHCVAGLDFLAVFIALLGIANTLALSDIRPRS
jgi:putative ABC transport system ATP-binding protein